MTAHEPPFPDVHVLVQYINIGSYGKINQQTASSVEYNAEYLGALQPGFHSGKLLTLQNTGTTCP